MTWTLAPGGGPANATVQRVYCRCRPGSVPYLVRRQAHRSPEGNPGFIYAFACSPQSVSPFVPDHDLDLNLDRLCDLPLLPDASKVASEIYREKCPISEASLSTQRTLSAIHRTKETNLATRRGERVTSLPVSKGSSMPKTTHRSGFASGKILFRRFGDQDLQWILRAFAAPPLRSGLYSVTL